MGVGDDDGVSNIKIDLTADRVIIHNLISYLNQLLRPLAANLKLFLYHNDRLLNFHNIIITQNFLLSKHSLLLYTIHIRMLKIKKLCKCPILLLHNDGGTGEGGYITDLIGLVYPPPFPDDSSDPPRGGENETVRFCPFVPERYRYLMKR